MPIQILLHGHSVRLQGSAYPVRPVPGVGNTKRHHPSIERFKVHRHVCLQCRHPVYYRRHCFHSTGKHHATRDPLRHNLLVSPHLHHCHSAPCFRAQGMAQEGTSFKLKCPEKKKKRFLGHHSTSSKRMASRSLILVWLRCQLLFRFRVSSRMKILLSSCQMSYNAT